METPPPPAPRPGYWVALVGLAFLAAGGAVWFFLLREDGPTPPSVHGPTTDTTPPPDPRLTFATSFKNVHPDVKYVGDAACAKCHKDIHHSYHQHPMGRSAAFPKDNPALEKYEPAAHNPFQTKAHQLSVLDAGAKHRVSGTGAAATLPPYETSVDVVIGSGTRGKSYLTIDRGSAWQSPISWFTDDKRWNVSPGFELGEGGRRAIRGECLFCHVDRTEPVPKSNNLFTKVLVGQAAIGCERCHGPGELHVQLHLNGAGKPGRDDTIVNPKHLTQQLQMDICRQCHLLGEQRVVRRGREVFEFRPGLPLDQFLSVFVRHPDLADSQRSVGQFEQMERSGCFTRGNGTMTCTSCHDPHVSPAAADKPAFYRAKCLTCHETQGCKEAEPVRLTKANDCIACHMPKRGSTSIAHAAVTDHLIPRRGDVPPPVRKAVEPLPGILPVVPYRQGPHAPPAEERDRDLGVALSLQLTKMAASNPAVVRSVARTAVGKLTASTERWPTDDAAWLRLAGAYGLLGDPRKRVEAAKRAVELYPESETALAGLAESHMAAADPGAALPHTEKLIRLNPAAVEYRLLRASALMLRKEWAGAEQVCRDALAINPVSAEAHLLRAMALNGAGKADEARKAADIAFALETNPDVQKQYRQWLGTLK